MELVGRDAERAALTAALDPPDARVALVGPGGAGKTALARTLPDAVWCPLAGCRAPDDLVPRLASALGVELGDAADGARLARALGPRTLVLDGAEPVLEAVGSLLAGLPAGRVLLTSRVRPAFLPVLEVGPLGLPASDDLASARASDAGRLFLACAALARPGWAPAPEEGPAIAELVRRLDGLPLALRLAAARLRVLGTRQLLDLLDERFRLLSGAEGSLEAVVRASFDLLSAEDRALLGGLAWFGGAFDPEAVAAIAGGDRLDALARVEALVDHSLVRSWELDALPGVRWFALYESVRAWAGREGTPSAARWLAARAQGWVAAASGPGQREAVERLAAWAHDLRRALDEGLAERDGELAGRAVLALDAVWKRRGPASARGPALRAAAGLGGPLADAVWLAGVEARAFDADPARLERVRSSARASGDVALLAWASRTSARERVARGELGPALEEAREAAALAPDDPRALATLAEAEAASGSRAEAVRTYHRALAACRESPREEAAVLGFLAMLEHELGRTAEARSLAERAVRVLDDRVDPRRAAIVAQLLGDVALTDGDLDRAETAWRDALARLEAVGEPRWRAWCRAGLAMARARRGDGAGGLAGLRDALGEAVRVDPPRTQGFIAVWAAVVAARSGALQDAESLLEAADPSYPQVAAGLGVARAALELARGRAAREAGDPALASTLEAHARAWLATADRAGWPTEVRQAAAWLDAEVAEGAAPAAVDATIARDGSWFEADGARVSLGTRHANRRVLARLLEAHRDGSPATVADLLAAGWPGERVLPEAGAARVYTAVATLRREGLKVIEKTESGYRLRPGAVVEVV